MHQRRAAYSLIDDPLPVVSDAYALVCRRLPDAAATWNSRAVSLVMRDLAHHVRFISSAAALNDPAILADYIDWIDVLCVTLQFRKASMAASLRCIAEAIVSYAEIPGKLWPDADRSASEGLADWFIRGALLLESAGRTSNPYMVSELEDNPTAGLFLNALLEGKRGYALSIVGSLQDKGFGLTDLYDRLFVPSQRELGRLWHLGKISVAQEHFVTAATQVIISGMYESLFRSGNPKRTGALSDSARKPAMIAACAQGELHEMGIRMSADSFQANGWETIFLGANLPERELIKEILRLKPALLSLSATIPTHLEWIERTIEDARASGCKARILVGGRPFRSSPGLWRELGADATAADCREALGAAEALLESV